LKSPVDFHVNTLYYWVNGLDPGGCEDSGTMLRDGIYPRNGGRIRIGELGDHEKESKKEADK
jgi:hypothetical protein